MSVQISGTIPEQEANQLNVLQLAYLGDAVWETIVRFEMVRQRKKVHYMHLECVQYVNARAQSELLRLITPLLTERETDIVHRGRNTHARHPAPRHQAVMDYAASTAFEALIGYLYLTGQEDRLSYLSRLMLAHGREDSAEEHEENEYG